MRIEVENLSATASPFAHTYRPEEVELEAKYAGADGAEIESLRRRLDSVDFSKKRKS